jgi:hypothetical protein
VPAEIEGEPVVEKMRGPLQPGMADPAYREDGTPLGFVCGLALGANVQIAGYQHTYDHQEDPLF